MAKQTKYTYDRKSKRWRLNGKWTKAPKASQLVKDAKGELRDAKGKPVSRALFLEKEPKKKPAKTPKSKKASKAPKPSKRPPSKKPASKRKQPKRKPAKPKPHKAAAKVRKQRQRKPRESGLGPVPAPPTRPGRPQILGRFPKRGQATYLPDGSPITEHAIISSRYENVKHPEHAAEVLQNTFLRKAEKQKLDPNDLVLYGYGLEFVCTSIPMGLDDTHSLVRKLAREYPDFDFKFNEGSVHVLLGGRDKPAHYQRAVSDLKDKKTEILDIYYYLADFWDGDIGWFAFAENDEMEGGS